MVILQAIILGIIEGLTEFLPISSTGHLIVAEKAMGYYDVAEMFTVVVQLGAIAAVIWHYRKDLISRTFGLLQPRCSVLEIMGISHYPRGVHWIFGERYAQ